MEKSEKQFRFVTIEEYFSEENGKVYWNWRFEQVGEWHKELSPYKEIPIVRIKKPNPPTS